MVQAISLAGSGPNFLPYFLKLAFTLFTVKPGSTFTLFPFSNTSMFLKFLLVSTRNPSVTPCPLKDVPPDRKVIPKSFELTILKIFDKSSAFFGFVTTEGVKR